MIFGENKAVEEMRMRKATKELALCSMLAALSVEIGRASCRERV